MTSKEIADKSWTLWSDYYKDGDKDSSDILLELQADIDALLSLKGPEKCSHEPVSLEGKYTKCKHCSMVLQIKP